jgi:arylformamidase
LLVDLPSIDRLFDEGKLLNHRIFWNVEEGSREVNHQTRMSSTITELIYVRDEVPDGDYLLNLQIPPFESDAAPSRPLLFHRVLKGGL